MADEHVTGDLPYVLKEAEIEGFVLKPRDLQITVDISTVGVPVSKISVMMLFVRGYRKPPICTDADWKSDKNSSD